MSDVTCKAAHTFLDVLAERGVDPALLAARTNHSLEFLREKNNRITWAEFVHIGRVTRELCALEDADLEDSVTTIHQGAREVVAARPDPKVLICGTGRAGTTLLVQILTDLGQDTGLPHGTPHGERAGMAMAASGTMPM